MKKVLVYALAFIFVTGTAFISVNAQGTKPEVKKEQKDTTKKKEVKAEKKEMKKESGKKGTKGTPHHKAPVKKDEAKKDTTKKK